MKTKQAVNYKKLEPHPLGAIFPPMSDADYNRLADSIKKEGLKEDIVLFEGKILDGNNRYTACKKVRVEPTFTQFKNGDSGSALSFVVARNMARRHLTPSQLSTVGAELAEKMKAEAEAEKARIKAEKAAGKAARKPVAKGKTHVRAAKAVGASPRNVSKAEALKKDDPAAFEEVKAGKTSLHAASRKAEKKKSEAEAQTTDFDAACNRIDATLGEGWARKQSHLKPKEIIELSGLDPGEMSRIKGHIEAGWRLKQALSYKATLMVPASNLRQLIDRAISEGGHYTLEILNHIVTVSPKEVQQ